MLVRHEPPEELFLSIDPTSLSTTATEHKRYFLICCFDGHCLKSHIAVTGLRCSDSEEYDLHDLPKHIKSYSALKLVYCQSFHI